MDTLNFVVTWNNGGEPKCILVTKNHPKAMAVFNEAAKDPKIDHVKLYGSATPTKRWSPSKVAKIVSENNSRLAKEAEAAANAERDKAKADLAQAEAAVKDAKARIKGIDPKE